MFQQISQLFYDMPKSREVLTVRRAQVIALDEAGNERKFSSPPHSPFDSTGHF